MKSKSRASINLFDLDEPSSNDPTVHALEAHRLERATRRLVYSVKSIARYVGAEVCYGMPDREKITKCMELVLLLCNEYRDIGGLDSHVQQVIGNAFMIELAAIEMGASK